MGNSLRSLPYVPVNCLFASRLEKVALVEKYFQLVNDAIAPFLLGFALSLPF